MLLSLAEHFSKERYHGVYWLNEINLSKVLAYLDTSNTIGKNTLNSFFIFRIYNKIWKCLIIYTKTIICLRLSEHCWIISSTSSRGCFNNIHFLLMNNCQSSLDLRTQNCSVWWIPFKLHTSWSSSGF